MNSFLNVYLINKIKYGITFEEYHITNTIIFIYIRNDYYDHEFMMIIVIYNFKSCSIDVRTLFLIYTYYY